MSWPHRAYSFVFNRREKQDTVMQLKKSSFYTFHFTHQTANFFFVSKGQLLHTIKVGDDLSDFRLGARLIRISREINSFVKLRCWRINFAADKMNSEERMSLDCVLINFSAEYYWAPQSDFCRPGKFCSSQWFLILRHFGKVLIAFYGVDIKNCAGRPWIFEVSMKRVCSFVAWVWKCAIIRTAETFRSAISCKQKSWSGVGQSKCQRLGSLGKAFVFFNEKRFPRGVILGVRDFPASANDDAVFQKNGKIKINSHN